MKTIGCLCGEKATLKKGTISQAFENEEILVHDVPLYHCSGCNRTYFDVRTNFSKHLTHAQHHQMNEISLNEQVS